MSKIRGIKPETWTDKKIVQLSPLARLLFIGMWNFCCDNGHTENSPIQLKMRVLPADNCDINELIKELLDSDLVVVEGDYLHVPTLTEHQRPHKRWWKTCDKPGCAPPEGASRTPDNSGATVAQPLVNSSTTVDNGCPTADVDVDGDVDSEITTSRHGTADAVPRHDVEEVLDHLEASVTARGARRPSRNKQARDAARLLIDRDGKTVTQIKAAIDFADNDSFWRKNILSMPTLRKQYDRLALSAQEQRRPPAKFDDIAAMGEELQKQVGG